MSKSFSFLSREILEMEITRLMYGQYDRIRPFCILFKLYSDVFSKIRVFFMHLRARQHLIVT